MALAEREREGGEKESQQKERERGGETKKKIRRSLSLSLLLSFHPSLPSAGEKGNGIAGGSRKKNKRLSCLSPCSGSWFTVVCKRRTGRRKEMLGWVDG